MACQLLIGEIVSRNLTLALVLGIEVFICCAACTADGNGTTYNEHINVALAVAMPDGGLITPVVKDADVTDIYQVSTAHA